MFVRLVLPCFLVFGAHAQPETNAPKAAPFPEAARSLASFRIERGFRIEVVAAAPLVVSPVAMAFDENGRLFVAEMRDYPSPGNKTPHPGRIRLLEDTDGDGVFDKTAVFADGLTLPSAVACYDGGVFCAATHEILYLKDTTGAGVADVRQVVFNGFGGTTGSNPNPDALVNSLTWGLDNRIHGLTAGMEGLVSAASAVGATPVPLTNSDFSFDPRTATLRPEAGPAQSGLCFDSSGRKFVSDPARPLRCAMIDPRYFERNPFVPRPPALLDVANPATTVYRFAPSAAILKPGSSAPGTDRLVPAWFATARGCAVYRGAAFPANYAENVFVADSAANLVHRFVLRGSGFELAAARPPEEAGTEFLVAKDPLFHPTQIVNGPDGALYVADLREGGDSGRIYRIVPDNFKQPKLPQMGGAKTYDLVASLAQAGGWQRDTAARLLYTRQDSGAVELLTNALNNSRLALVRLYALCALDGQGALTEAAIIKGLRDPDERVRERAVRLSEKLIRNGTVSDPLWAQLRALGADPSARVRCQLAFSLGSLRHAERSVLLAQLLQREPANRWLQAAVLSSLGEGAGEMFVTLAADPRSRSDPGLMQFLHQLLVMIGLKGRPDEVGQVLSFVQNRRLDQQTSFTFLADLGQGLEQAGSWLATVDPQTRLQPFYDQAIEATLNDSLPTPLRAEAIRLRGFSPATYIGVGDLNLLMFGTGQPESVQSAAIATLAHYENPTIPTNLLARWQYLSPALRNQAIGALLQRNYRAVTVLDALDSGAIRDADLSSTQINFLRTHRNPFISERAVRRFGPFNPQRPGRLGQFLPALNLGGVATRGRALFQARCAACHEIAGAGLSLGPDLAEAKRLGKQQILEAIIEPSAEVRPGFGTQVLDTKTGESLMGVLVDVNDKSVTLRQPGSVGLVYPQTNVDVIQPREWSLMPAGLEQGLSPQAMADLLDFIMTAPQYRAP